MKKKIIILSSIIALILISTITYAAYSFTRTPKDEDVELGKITLNEKKFVYFENNTSAGEEIVLDENGDNNSYSVDNNVITVYATKKGGYDDELENTIYLNQIGFDFTFTNTIDVYVRLHIEDSWISHKVYSNGTIVENVIRQDANAHPSNFVDSEVWYYDEATGYFYLRQKVEANSNESNTYSFKTDPSYYYIPAQNKNYREAVFVELSFTVDIVQANRAAAKWGVDVNSLITKNEEAS